MKLKIILSLMFFIYLTIIHLENASASTEQIDATLTIGDETVTNNNPTFSNNKNPTGESSNKRYVERSIKLKCIENWICTEWSDCIKNIQTISCFDSNNCQTSEMKPNLERECIKEVKVEPVKEVPKQINSINKDSLLSIIMLAILLIYFAFYQSKLKLYKSKVYKR